jgi:AcrR family transcriptional regulator
MAPKPDVSEERKQQILEAASEVFSQKGFDDARMEDIAEQTGLSKGSLYLYFKSKDDLITSILDLAFQREFKQIENLDASEMSATEALEKIVDLALEDFAGMLRLLPVAYEFLALAFRNRVVQKALKEYFNRYMNVMVPVVQRGIDSGEFRAVDAKQVAIATGAILEGTILLWVYDKSLVNPEQHIRTGIQLLLEGLQAPPARQA